MQLSITQSGRFTNPPDCVHLLIIVSFVALCIKATTLHYSVGFITTSNTLPCSVIFFNVV